MEDNSRTSVLEPKQNAADELFDTWEPQSPMRPVRRRRLWMIPAAVIAFAGVAYAGWRLLATPEPPAYATSEVQRGTIEKTISATGKVQAVTTVQVGTQVSGTVSELYADYNQQVVAGQLIAKLDPSQLEAQLMQANASLSSAQARVQSAQMGVLSGEASVEAAEANLARTDSVLQDAQRNYDRTKAMVDAQVAARRDIETAQAAVAQSSAQRQQALAQVNQAKAQARSAQSQLAQAQAEMQQAQGAVELANVNLQRTLIRAPIDGVVVARNVDVGQTVAASLQAPVLFLIAKDLTKMQVLADIDEADVGQLTPQSKVRFTVDAFPEDTFSGRISQIRLAPQTIQNVVTYTAVIDVDNSSLQLKPGMTANLTATVAERRDVVMVPSAALRFRPDDAAQTVPGPVAYKLSGGQLIPVPVQLGLTDGVRTEVTAGDLQPGDKLAVPVQQQSAPRGGASGNRSAFPMGGAMRGGRR